jgi:putative oxidoreductase
VIRQILKIINGDINIHIVLLMMRLFVGSVMLTHGIPKLIQLAGAAEIHFADPIGLGEVLSFYLVVFAEAFCSILVIIGLATRLAAIPLIINMSVIVYIVQAGDPFGRKELPIFYLITYIFLFILGSGKYSLDKIIIKTLK